MNELDKLSPEQEAPNPEPSVIEEKTVVAETAEATPEVEKADTSSEVDASAEAKDVAPEQVSVSDELSEIERKTDVKRYHDMTKSQLVATLKDIVDSNDMEAHKDVAAIKQAFFALRTAENEKQLADFIDAGNAPEAFTSAPDNEENELKELLSIFKERRNSYLEALENEHKENLEKKKEIIAKLKDIVSDIDNINMHFPTFQQLQQDFKTIGDVPPGSEADTWKEYQAVIEQFYDHLKMNKELRDLDFKKNLEVKRRLIDEAKALEGIADVVAAFRSLQTLHKEWREVGPVAKELRDEIWDEFKAASTVINKRHQDYFEERKNRELENEEAKNKLIEEASAIDLAELKNFSDWDNATKKIIEIQAEWKKLGFASRKNNNTLFANFREICDKFFAEKAEFFKKTREELASNLEKKIALCEKAEALKESADIAAATQEVLKLQAEWKTIGSVARKQSDAVWERFTKACNYFFEERRKAQNARRKDENANLAAKRDVIAKLREIPTDIERNEAITAVKELQNKWQEIGHVPFKIKDKLYAEYREVVDALYDAYNTRETNRRMSNFRGQISKIRDDENKMFRERERLLRAYDQKRNELNTYENNLGFFNIKSSAGNIMVKELEKKIKAIKEDMKELEAKINILDSKED